MVDFAFEQQDPDFHRRDRKSFLPFVVQVKLVNDLLPCLVYDAIEAGAYPKWKFGVQVIPEEREHEFDFGE